jgi:hypothetical protein
MSASTLPKLRGCTKDHHCTAFVTGKKARTSSYGKHNLDCAKCPDLPAAAAVQAQPLCISLWVCIRPWSLFPFNNPHHRASGHPNSTTDIAEAAIRLHHHTPLHAAPPPDKAEIRKRSPASSLHHHPRFDSTDPLPPHQSDYLAPHTH